MSRLDATLIRFEPDRTVFVSASTAEWTLPVGASALASSTFRHDPPTAGELEQAIDRVEDALAAAGSTQAVRGDLHTTEQALIELLATRTPEGRLAREAVEARFQMLAMIALGRPRQGELAHLDAEGAALLLILRECMHHLGFQAVRWGPEASAPQG